MKAFRAAFFVGILAAIPASAANKNIVISDSLTANADELKVKMGSQWMGIHKWRVGDYAVVASKLEGTRTSTKSNFFKTKSETKSSNRFSFVLTDKTADSAFVFAAHEMLAQSEHGLKVGKSVTLGNDGLVQESDKFTAFITINRDTSDEWTLFMGASSTPNNEGVYQTVLTNETRNILLTFSTSKKNDAPSGSFFSKLASQVTPPAMGYEFIENGQSLCAVQFFSQGMAGQYKQIAWMRRDVDPRLKLVLAAAMTTVLEKQCSESGPALPDQE